MPGSGAAEGTSAGWGGVPVTRVRSGGTVPRPEPRGLVYSRSRNGAQRPGTGADKAVQAAAGGSERVVRPVGGRA